MLKKIRFKKKLPDKKPVKTLLQTQHNDCSLTIVCKKSKIPVKYHCESINNI